MQKTTAATVAEARIQSMRIISADERLAEKSGLKVHSVYGLHA
jgi:hypothetical protein